MHCDLLDAGFCWMLNWQGPSIYSQLPTENTAVQIESSETDTKNNVHN